MFARVVKLFSFSQGFLSTIYDRCFTFLSAARRSASNETKTTMKTYQERFAAAYDYWISQDAPPSAARDLAHDQLDFEDQQNEPETLGSNDSLPLHSY